MRYSQHVVKIAIFILEVCQVLSQSGEWTEWTDWSSCSVTCGYGIQKRQRTWKSPDNRHSGKPIVYEDIVECMTKTYTPCPVDGNWSFWGPWSDCSEMCNGGTTKRTRECDAPKPSNGGKACEGKAFVDANCNEWTCPPLPPNFDITKCNETTFMCLSRLQCIPSTNACDDTLQCHDGSDEHNCDYYNWNSGAGTIPFAQVLAMVLSIVIAVIIL